MPADPSELDDDVPTDTGQPLPPTATDPARARLQRWRDRLLDLSLHNRLLNFRPATRTSLELVVDDLEQFGEALAAGMSFDVGAPADFANRRVAPSCPAEEAVDRARALDRACRVDREEGGANTCFAAIGSLRWVDPSTGEPRLAPLVMVPVRVSYNRLSRGVSVTRAEEDPVGNVTLVEKARRDFGLDLSVLSGVSTDEGAELDVGAVLDAVAAAVAPMTGWGVERRVFLGRLLFTKFIAWTDLDEHGDTILASQVVRHIATAGAQALPDPGPASLDDLDAMPLVLDADSTQSGAVASALAGRTMVIQGPPGTGKSQTITNLIATAIADGKTVLFVSEKLAALEVVHRRLVDVGLGDYCLELHSQKANKREVAQSLAAALDRSDHVEDPGWAARGQALGGRRAPLDSVVEALHRSRPLGISLHAGMERLLDLGGAPGVTVSLAAGAALAERDWRDMAGAVATLAAVAGAVEPVGAHPWRDARAEAWTEALDADLRRALGNARQAQAESEAALADLAAALGVLAPPETGGLLVRAGEAIGAAPGAPVASAEARLQASAWLARARGVESRRAALSTRWTPAFFVDPHPGALADFRRWATAFFLFSFLFLFFPRSRLSAMARGPLGPSPRVRDDLETLSALRAEEPAVERDRAGVVTSLGGAWDGTEVEGLAGVLAAQEKLVEVVDEAEAAGLPLRTALEGGFAAARGPLATTTARARAAMEQPAAARQAVQVLAAVDDAGDVDERIAAAGEFRPWCLYRAAARGVTSLGLGALVDAHAAGTTVAARLDTDAERAVLAAWTRAVRDAEPALATFAGDAQHLAVRRFVEADREHLSRARQFVLARLDARRPALVVEGTEAGIVAREAKKQRAHWPIRRLLGAIPNLLPRLKPCLLMSPLSVAQYLPPGGRRFDLVVFDEASQIGTHDAIGALARGNSAVVVGDSRQLPPTSFFQSERSDADEEPELVELESILDEAVAARLPQHLLGWHYRSRHQALIAFSNERFYDSRLHVFPAARHEVDDLGVRHHPVAGVYGRGGSRQNPEEAEALVAWLVSALSTHDPGSRTFGVVTFSVAQQSLVEDLLDEARGAHPEIEPHFSTDLHEPVFVKNLENVQGDERDVILFSTCYGPDEQGQVAMNFGPLNKPGGERRLNVAVTRARRCLRVFSSLPPDRIDLSRTAAEGVIHLRAFLHYAQAGGGLGGAGHDASTIVGVAAQVSRALAAHGYTVAPRVGSGAYRVDLAVVDPDRPGEFLLGIEFDGTTYARAATTRDRDRLRAQVLAGLGWRLCRVWTLDWWYDRERETQRILAALVDARAGAAAPPPPSAAPRPARALPSGARAPADGRIPAPPWAPAPPAPGTRRDIDALSAATVDDALATILAGAIAIEEGACRKLLAKQLGFSRRGAKIDAALGAAVGRALARGRARREGDRLVWIPSPQ